MFTGIVEETGEVVAAGWSGDSYRMTLRGDAVLADARQGDSISVNGTCLTVMTLDGDQFTVGLAPETLKRTNLGRFGEGDEVNLEGSMTSTSKMGGHFVQGHIDGVGHILEREADGDSLRLVIGIDPAMAKWIVPKGFIALDGISLTVVDAMSDRFSVMLIDYTLKHVTLGRQPLGYPVNIEADILGKYVERFLEARFGSDAAARPDGLSATPAIWTPDETMT